MPKGPSASARSGVAAPRGTEAEAQRPRRRLWFMVKVVLALALLTLLLAHIGWQSVVETFVGLNLWWIPILLLLRLVRIFLQSARWRLFLTTCGVKASHIRLFKRYLISRLFNNLLPGQLGGDAYRIMQGLGSGETKTQLASSVIMDRVAGLIGLTLVAAISGLVYLAALQDAGLAFLPILAGAGCIVLVGLSTTRPAVGWVRSAASYLPSDRIRSLAARILDDLAVHVDRRDVLLTGVAIGVAYYALAAFETYLAFRAFGVDVDLVGVMVISPIIAMISSIPISINGWGITEAASVLLYTQLGVSAPDAFATALLGRISFTMMAAIGGLIYLWESWHGPSRAKRPAGAG